jgi:hypothetical protein
MSKSVDLFIHSDQPIESVAAAVERLTQLTMKPGELPSTWMLVKDDLRVELRVNPYVSDGELDLDRYAYAMSARASGGRLTDSPEAALLRAVADRLHSEKMRTLLVHDLQYKDRGAAASTAPEAGDGEAAPAVPAETP